MAAGVQKFCLRWNDFQGLVTSAFNCLRKDEELVDVTLCCEGRMIKAHKMMLSACSPYFKEVLKGNPCQHPVFFMKDVKYSDMAAIMDFVYTGEVNVAQNSLSGFLKTAEALQVRGLTEESQGSGPAGDGPTLGSPAPSEHANSSRLKRATPPTSDPATSAASPSSVKRSRHRSRSPPSLQPEEPSPATHVPAEESEVVGDDAWDDQKVKLETLDEEESGLDGVLEAHDSLDGMLNFQGAGTLPVEASIHGEGAGDSSTGYIPDLSAPDGVSWARGGPRGPAGAVPGPQPAARPCPFCGKRYRHRQSLHKHVQMHRGRTRCHVCGETLATIETLTHHLRNRHSVEKEQLITLL